MGEQLQFVVIQSQLKLQLKLQQQHRQPCLRQQQLILVHMNAVLPMMSFPSLEIATSTSCVWPMPMEVTTCKNSLVEIGYSIHILTLALTLPYPQMITFAKNNLCFK